MFFFELAVALAVVLVILLFLIYAGVFQATPLIYTKLDRGTLVGYKHVGDYSKVHPVFVKVRRQIEQHNLHRYLRCCAGLYHDNPSKVPSQKCRSFCGFLTQKILTDEEKAQMENIGFRVRDIPNMDCLTTIYPFRRWLGSFSFMFAAVLVYMSIGKQLGSNPEMAEEESGMMELYTDNYIQFLVPTSEFIGFADIDYVEQGKRD